MAGGQFMDLISKYHNNVGYETLKFIHTRKTASLFITAGEIGSVLGGAGPDASAAIHDYATHVGFAFQILDDLLDIQGTGKDLGKDTLKDTVNFGTLFGPRKAARMVEKETAAAVRAIRMFEGRNDRLVELAEFLLKRNM
jgi:geranylgeranyl diphosphate synthase type II